MIFLADVRFYEPNAGGIPHLARQGYRPTVRFAGDNTLHMARVNFLKVDGTPYEEKSPVPRQVMAEVWLFNEYVGGLLLEEGVKFQLTEGTHAVAEAAIEGSVQTIDLDRKCLLPPWRRQI
jgi:hypothetical protein